jgi:hypothetical protein
MTRRWWGATERRSGLPRQGHNKARRACPGTARPQRITPPYQQNTSQQNTSWPGSTRPSTPCLPVSRCVTPPNTNRDQRCVGAGFIALVAEENRLTKVAALGNVMGNAGSDTLAKHAMG